MHAETATQRQQKRITETRIYTPHLNPAKSAIDRETVVFIASSQLLVETNQDFVIKIAWY